MGQISKKVERLGERRQMNDGSWAEVVEYHNARNIVVKFDNGTTKPSEYQKFKIGGIKSTDLSLKEERIGERRRMRGGGWAEIVDYKNSDTIWVKFDSGPLLTTTQYQHFSSGNVKDPNRFNNLIGEERVMKGGKIAKIVECRTLHDLTVEFGDGHRSHTTYENFSEGRINHPYDKTVFGVGYLGVGPYRCDEGPGAKSYYTWHSMLKRAYDQESRHIYPTYKDVDVCEEWHNFQNFAKWHEENCYEIEGRRMHLDKDLKANLVGPKVYSPETCLYLPDHLNLQFQMKEGVNGLPRGVQKRVGKEVTRYHVTVRVGDGTLTKTFDTVEEAEAWYKEQKTKRVHDLATEIRDQLPVDVYEAVMNWRA